MDGNHTVVTHLARLKVFTVVSILSAVIFTYSIANAQTNTSAPLGPTPNFFSIPIKTDESVGEIMGITQDHKGFLWLAGSAGIARYDGYRFHTYPSPINELGDAYINDVYEDSLDGLWIAAADGGVARLNRDTDVFETYRVPQETSQQRFEKIYEDQQNNLWFAGSRGVARYDRNQDKLIRYLDTSPLKDEIALDMIQTETDQYLLASRNGIFLWHRQTNELEHFIPDTDQPGSLPNPVVRAFSKDNNGEIWIGHEQGLCRFNRQTKTFESVVIEHAVKERKRVSIWRMFTDKKGILWLGTDGNGVMYFNPESGEFGSYTKNVMPSSLNTTVVRSIYEDNLGDLWIGGYPAGLFHYNQSNNFFSIYSNFIRDQQDIYKNQTWAFVEDHMGNLWLGVDSLGLVYFDRKKHTFKQSYQGFEFSDKGFPYSALSLLLDSKGHLWIGSWAQGVSRFNLKTKEYKHYNPNASGGSPFIGESVWDIMESQNGDIYFATMNNGLVRYRYTDDEFRNVRNSPDNPNSLINNSVWSLLEADDGLIWLATFGGINLYDPKTNQFQLYDNDPDIPKSLSSNRVLSLFEDSQKRIWAGTIGGGLNLFHAENNSFTHIQVFDGLLSNDVQAITEDNQGLLWITTNKGISSLNPKTLDIQNYTDKNWLQNGEFVHNAQLKLQNGDIAFGGINGFNILRPNEVTSNTYVPPVYLTELVVLNTPITATEKNTVIQKDIVEADKIYLSHEDSMVSLTFSALSYRVYDDNQYRYKLVGFDKDWRIIPDNNKAIYTRLDAGKYQFMVMASNNDKVWTKAIHLADIVIKPPPWRTWWAYGIYLSIMLYIVSWYEIAQKIKMKNARELNDKLIELDRLKDSFLANTSHELRTPLNGILGITQALQDGPIGIHSDSTRQSLAMIASCGRRLERLINNLLDFSKSKTGDLSLDLTCVNSGKLVEEILPECQSIIVNDQVTISNTIPTDIAPMFCDATRTKHIIYNLIANGIKFTERGSIKISASVTNTEVSVSVKDTGVGIAKERLSQLYTSFTQLTESGIHTQSGTGLGLAMAKYFVEAQGGQLSVATKLGMGSTFTVTLPRATEQQLAEHPVAQTQEAYPISPVRPLPPPSEDDLPIEKATGDSNARVLTAFYPQSYVKEKNYPRILVVDDEVINRMVLREIILKHNFIVYEAVNGQEVLDTINGGFMCDLILMDIMMPKLSGLEACKAIRKKYSPPELPIIFISAKSQTRDVVECFNINGNDFLSKPVNRDELLSRINAQLQLSKEYRQLQSKLFHFRV